MEFGLESGKQIIKRTFQIISASKAVGWGGVIGVAHRDGVNSLGGLLRGEDIGGGPEQGEEAPRLWKCT